MEDTSGKPIKRKLNPEIPRPDPSVYKPSKGIILSWTMLILFIVEWLVVYEGVSGEIREGIRRVTLAQMYFIVLSFSLLLQSTGIFLVRREYYKLGGVLQIIASFPHAFVLDGIIGLLGGYDAYTYEEELAEVVAARGPKVPAAG